MHVHDFGLVPPGLTCIFEVAYPFFLLGVNADRGLSSVLVQGALLGDIGKLRVTIRMGCPIVLFDILMKPIVPRFQQAADHGLTDLLAHTFQRLDNIH